MGRACPHDPIESIRRRKPNLKGLETTKWPGPIYVIQFHPVYGSPTAGSPVTRFPDGFRRQYACRRPRPVRAGRYPYQLAIVVTSTCASSHHISIHAVLVSTCADHGRPEKIYTKGGGTIKKCIILSCRREQHELRRYRNYTSALTYVLATQQGRLGPREGFFALWLDN